MSRYPGPVPCIPMKAGKIMGQSEPSLVFRIRVLQTAKNESCRTVPRDSFVFHGVADLVKFGVDVLSPAVLVHVVAHVGVTGFLFLLQPVIEVALYGVGGDGHAAALFEDDTGQLEAGHGILQVLAEVAEVGALLFGVTVIFPQRGNDLAIGGLRAPVIDEEGDDFLGAGIFEGNRLSVDEKFKVAEGLRKDALVAVLADGVAEVVKLFLHAVFLCRLDNIAAGVELESVVAMVGAVCAVDQVDLRIEIPEVLSQEQTVHFGHVSLQKGDVDHLLSGSGEGSQAAGMADDLGFGKDRGNIFFSLFEYLFIAVYDKNGHYINPPA